MSNQKNIDNKAFVENEILSLIKLYVETYMIESEKGFKSLEERRNRFKILNNGILDIIQDGSEHLGISTNEIADIILECLIEEEINPEIKAKYKEEYDLIRQELKGIEQRMQEER